MLEAEIDTLAAMGYDRSDAREALLQTGCVLEAAVEWLCLYGGV